MPTPVALRHPEHIHPALWKASQLAQAQRPTLPTGFRGLDRQLPGQGWPIGALIDITLNRPGIGEIALLRPALAQLNTDRSIIFIHPPYSPHFHCLTNWGLHAHRVYWIKTDTPTDTTWACDQALRHNACSALVCWAPNMRAQTLRRLHLAARQSDTLFIVLRPNASTHQPCAAPLRLALQPAPQGLQVAILKRSGPVCSHSIPISLYPSRAYSNPGANHVSLDQPSSASSQSGRRLSVLAH